MPYQWSECEEGHTNYKGWTLRLWPNRSLSNNGFAIFIGVTAALFLLPLLAVLGSPILWGLLPFIVGTIWLTWVLLRRNTTDGRLRENLQLRQNRIELVRINPRGATQSWQANPYWVQVALHESGGPVPNYLTLAGSGREVEVGAFLSPEERLELYKELSDRLRGLDINAP